MNTDYRRAIRLSAVLCAVFVGSGQVASAQDAKKPARREQTVRLAGIVLKWLRADKEANYRRIEPLIREAASTGAKLVCTTECFLDGYAVEDKKLALDKYQSLGEEIPSGAYYQRLAGLAGELKIHLVVGMTEASDKFRYNTAVLIGPDGQFIGKTRKQRLGPAEDRNAAGDACNVFDTAYGRIGLAIGADRTDPAVVRGYYDQGASVLLCPAGAWGPLDSILAAQARSRENNMHIVSVHPVAFLMTGPDGANRKREILGDQLLIAPDEVNGEQDESAVVYFDLPIRPKNAATEIDKAVFQPMEGQALYYRSSVYGDLQPLAVCATDVSPVAKPLLVNLTGIAFPKSAAQECQSICRRAQNLGLDCVVLCTGGRSGGSVHQGYGEVDVYEAIAAVQKRLAIDPDRISVTGGSVGGAATWYHASHYPDVWAAAAPRFGYCDDKIWEKASLSSFPRRNWEDFSWTARSAAYRTANLRHVALRITHGEWDRAIPGGVPVEHSRQMDRQLTELGIPHTYIELEKTGHADSPAQWDELVTWLLTQQKDREPDRVSLVVHGLRHNRSDWVAVEQQIESGKASSVEAVRDRAQTSVKVQTTNVLRLALGPLAEATGVTFDLDDNSFPDIDLMHQQQFARSPNGEWIKADTIIPPGHKRPGLSGPFGDLFIAPTIIVYGQSGTDEASEYNQSVAFGMSRLFNQSNGGVHRGSIPGDNNVMLPVISDRRLLELLAEAGPAGPFDLESRLVSGDYAKVAIDKEVLQRANLFLIGDADSNAVLASLAHQLPVVCDPRKVTLGVKTYQGAHLAFFAIFPHPDGRRYVALLAGNEPDAICWGCRVGLQLLPDYLVFAHDRVVDFGFWDNRWQHAGVSRPAPK